MGFDFVSCINAPRLIPLAALEFLKRCHIVRTNSRALGMASAQHMAHQDPRFPSSNVRKKNELNEPSITPPFISSNNSFPSRQSPLGPGARSCSTDPQKSFFYSRQLSSLHPITFLSSIHSHPHHPLQKISVNTACPCPCSPSKTLNPHPRPLEFHSLPPPHILSELLSWYYVDTLTSSDFFRKPTTG